VQNEKNIICAQLDQ